MASLFVRKEVEQIEPYNSGLTVADLVARFAPKEVSKLGSNESPYGASPLVRKSIQSIVESTHFYPDPAGRELRRILAERHGVAPAQVILGNGSEDLISVICRTVLRPGDRMVTLYPSFPLHEDHAVVMGASIERVPLGPDLAIDVEALGTALRGVPRMAMFANPMNPVGAWLDDEQFSTVRRGLDDSTLLVVDEAYAEYMAGLAPARASAVAENRTNWIVLRTFSKAWGLAGFRIGYAIVGDAELASYLDRVRTPFNANAPAQIAAIAALSDEAHMLGAVAATVNERNRVRATLVQRGYRVAESRTNFLFFDIGQSAATFNEEMLAQGVIIKPWKQDGYRSFVRVSIGTPRENDHFLEALETVLR